MQFNEKWIDKIFNNYDECQTFSNLEPIGFSGLKDFHFQFRARGCFFSVMTVFASYLIFANLYCLRSLSFFYAMQPLLYTHSLFTISKSKFIKAISFSN